MPSVRPVPPADPDEVEDDDALDEGLDLPAVGDETEEPPAEEGHDDEISSLLDELEDNPLDDASDDDFDTGVELDPLDEEGGHEGETELDVGAIDEGIFDDGEDSSGDPENTADLGPEGSDIDLDERGDADDGGAEGTGDDPEDEVDEAALPELDADDEGDEGDEELAGVLLADTAALRWDAARWSVIAGAGAAVPVSALSIAGARVAAAGDVLLLVDEGAQAARRASFGEGATAVALTDGLLLTVGPRAQLLLSIDGGDAASQLPGWKALTAPIELAATPGRVWLRCDEALLCLSAPEQPPAIVRERNVLAMTASGPAIVVLRRTGGGPSLERLRSDDEGWHETLLRGAARRMIERPRRALLRFAAAAAGRVIAIADGARVVISRDAGRSFEALELGGAAALCFAGDDEAAPLLLLSSSLGAARGEAALVQILPGGEATRIAALPGIGEAKAAMSWDASRECLWVACEAGLLALGRPRKH